MRNLIIKYFALSYRVRIFKTEFAWLRASSIIFPLLCMLSLSIYSESLLATIIAGTLFLLSVYFGFIYFRFSPVNRDELDEEQKLFYNAYYGGTGVNSVPYNNTKRILLALANPLIGIITALIITYL